MKVESYQYYEYGNFVPLDFVIDRDKDYTSLYEVALTFRILLAHRRCAGAAFMVWLDNWRYLLVQKDTFDVHYHAAFNMKDIERLISSE